MRGVELLGMTQFEANRRKEFSLILRQLMDKWKVDHGKKLSQEALGYVLHVSRTTVNHWLSGKQYPAEDSLIRLADFFSVPVSFFSDGGRPHELTRTNEEAHRILEEQCRSAADKYGLSPAFVSFIKENPDIVDLILKASWVSTEAQSVDPSVPEMEGSLFQIVGRSGVKIYPPAEVLLMLSLVQREAIEAIQFFIQKRMGTITDYYTKHEGPPPELVFRLESQGMSGLSRDEESVVSALRLMDEKGIKDMVVYSAKIVHRIRRGSVGEAWEQAERRKSRK